jgi:pyrimidine deaminase RibD-like protein
MQLALEEALKCTPSPTAYCVGCVLVVRIQPDSPIVLSAGYSRELPGNTHAEANALGKTRSLTKADIEAFSPTLRGYEVPQLLRHTDVYTTLEPCSIRTSGLAPCADALIKAGAKRCIIGANEPPDFVNCEGAEKLKQAGIEVIWLEGFEERCLTVARRQV